MALFLSRFFFRVSSAPPAGRPFRILGGPRCAPPGAQFKKLCNTCPGMRSRLFALASERPGCVAAFQWRPSPAPAASGHTHRGWSATFQKDLCAYCIQPGSCPPTLEPAEGARSRMWLSPPDPSVAGSASSFSPSRRRLAGVSPSRRAGRPKAPRARGVLFELWSQGRAQARGAASLSKDISGAPRTARSLTDKHQPRAAKEAPMNSIQPGPCPPALER